MTGYLYNFSWTLARTLENRTATRRTWDLQERVFLETPTYTHTVEKPYFVQRNVAGLATGWDTY